MQCRKYKIQKVSILFQPYPSTTQFLLQCKQLSLSWPSSKYFGLNQFHGMQKKKSSFSGSPRNRNSLMVYTHRAFVSVSFKHRISSTLFWTCLFLWSCPGDLSKSNHNGRCLLYFSGCRMSPSVDIRVW